MKKHFLLFLFITTILTGFAQEEVLFIGLYTKASSGKSYWCRDMEMVKQVVKTVAEAQQLEIDFRKEHAKESPIVKIASKGSLVIYDFQKEDKSFNCSYRVIGWKEAKNNDEARQALENDKARIKKEYNGQPNELYSWAATGKIMEDTQKGKDGFEENYKKIITNGKTTAYMGFFKNNNTDAAIEIVITTYPKGTTNMQIPKLEESTKPQPVGKETKYTIEPGGRLQLNLDKIDNTDVKVFKVPVGKEDDLDITRKIKKQIREWILKDGKVVPREYSSDAIRG